MKIDHYGEMLVGCIDCNRWGHPGDDQRIMELLDSDLEARRLECDKGGRIGFGRRHPVNSAAEGVTVAFEHLPGFGGALMRGTLALP
jgi:hypothetical protein